MKTETGINGWLKAAMVLLAVLGMAALGKSADAAGAPTAGKIWLEGQSTLHAYKTEATSFDVALDAAEQAPIDQLLQKNELRGATLTLPVVHLRSGESKLDANLRDALKVRNNPDIVFKAAKIEAAPVEGQTFPVKLVGTLKVAGVEKAETIDAQGKLENGALRLTGTKPLKMTDFKVDPPVMMLGTIRCSNEINIKFDMLLK